MDFDALIIEIDKGIRTVFGGVAHGARADPAARIPEADLGEGDRRNAAALMRVNHCGEVCAQALYQGQALASKNPRIKSVLSQAAREEADHLAWSAKRIAELGGRTSILNPLWYLGSLAIGYAAGRIGDRWNLGFLAETERQVGKHLQGHLARLNPSDARTRALIETMEREELGHARTAQSLGANELPEPVKGAMRCASRVMTTTSYWI